MVQKININYRSRIRSEEKQKEDILSLHVEYHKCKAEDIAEESYSMFSTLCINSFGTKEQKDGKK